MDQSLRQRLVGIFVISLFAVIIAPVLFDGEGRIPEKITNIPPQPKRPDLSHIKTPEQPSLPGPSTQESPASAQQPAMGAESSPLWAVQVASFKDETKAARLRDTLRAADYSVYVREKLLSDGTLFTQVFIGPVITRAEAADLKARVKTDFAEQGLVVRHRLQ